GGATGAKMGCEYAAAQRHVARAIFQCSGSMFFPSMGLEDFISSFTAKQGKFFAAESSFLTGLESPLPIPQSKPPSIGWRQFPVWSHPVRGNPPGRCPP